MRRFLQVLLLVLAALVLGLGAAACGSDDDEGDGGAGEGDGGKKIKVGLVTDTGGVDDRGFNEFSINGLERAEKRLNVDGRTYVSNKAEDYLPNLTSAAEDGNELVIGVGFLLAPSTIQAATDNPDTQFAGIDHFYGGPGCQQAKTCTKPNAVGMVYPTEEAGYLAGIVAAMMTKTGTVSTVGGKKLPSVDNWIAGFQQAVKDTKPSVKTLNAYSQDFDDQAKCKEIALDQISQGSDVVFQVAGKCGLGAIDGACEKNVMAIGVDADQSEAGECVITSALKPLEDSVYGLIKTFKAGKLKGGQNLFFGIEQLPNAELLAPFKGDVPQNVKDAVAAAEKKLASGQIDPPATLDKVK